MHQNIASTERYRVQRPERDVGESHVLQLSSLDLGYFVPSRIYVECPEGTQRVVATPSAVIFRANQDRTLWSPKDVVIPPRSYVAEVQLTRQFGNTAAVVSANITGFLSYDDWLREQQRGMSVDEAADIVESAVAGSDYAGRYAVRRIGCVVIADILGTRSLEK